MDLGLKGKVAIVTGGSRGIGRSIALGLAAEGCRLAICARGAEKLEETASEIRAAGAEVLAQPVDATDGAALEQFVAAIGEKYGRIDILVNNVGGVAPSREILPVVRPHPRVAEEPDDWRGLFGR